MQNINSKEPLVLIVSNSFPPLLSASAVLIDNIFSKYKGRMKAIGGTNFTKIDPTFQPPCATEYLRHPRGRIAEAVWRRYSTLFLPLYYRFLLKKVKRVKPDVMFINYPNDVMFVASAMVAQKMGIPYYAYMHDLWEENMHDIRKKAFAHKWEPQILKGAKRVICCTETAQSHYQNKYGLSSELLLHPILDEEIDGNALKTNTPVNDKITVAFSGTLHSIMNQDAFAEMSKALDMLPDEYQFLWLPITPIPSETLVSKGINSDKIKQKMVNREELKQELMKADVLFAPLSHKNCSLDEVKTVFSNKLLGYLVSGTPILIFGPPDCHHVQLANNGKWAYVVDKDSPKALAKAIKKMTSPEFDKTQLIENALAEANRRRASRCANEVLKWVLADISINRLAEAE